VQKGVMGIEKQFITKKVAVIGTGLIGGSMALLLREKNFTNFIIGVESVKSHAEQAIQLEIVDQISTLEEAVAQSDLIIVAVPVVAALEVVGQVLDLVDRQVVVDVGSTKKELCGKLATHEKRSRFVASHPMWGTEFSGPKAATRFAFSGKAAVICNQEQSDEDALELVMEMYRYLGMHLLSMNADAHDMHTAYVSHISHITSFALANTVLEKEREENTIFELASGGFESTVRLAKSNADTWVPIFRQNKENVLDVLNEHISQLRKFKASIEKENWGYLRELIEKANQINRILK
jgi:prephenate dehydrogenase